MCSARRMIRVNGAFLIDSIASGTAERGMGLITYRFGAVG